MELIQDFFFKHHIIIDLYVSAPRVSRQLEEATCPAEGDGSLTRMMLPPKGQNSIYEKKTFSNVYIKAYALYVLVCLVVCIHFVQVFMFSFIVFIYQSKFILQEVLFWHRN